MKKLLLILTLLASATLAFAAPYTSIQVGTTPANGYILQTNGSKPLKNLK